MAKRSYVMSQSELKNLKEEAHSARQIVKLVEQENYGAGGRGSQLDKNALIKQAQQMEKIVADHSPKPIRGGDKDKLAKRAAELKEKLSEGMCSREEMKDIHKYPEAPMKHLEWEKRNSAAAYEYKQIMRRLEPGDPGASMVERLRRG